MGKKILLIVLVTGVVLAGGIACIPPDVPEPEDPNCQGKLVSLLAKEYGGLRKAVEAIDDIDSVKELQETIRAYCAGELPAQVITEPAD